MNFIVSNGKKISIISLYSFEMLYQDHISKYHHGRTVTWKQGCLISYLT